MEIIAKMILNIPLLGLHAALVLLACSQAFASPSLRAQESKHRELHDRSPIRLSATSGSYVNVSIAQTLFGCKSNCMRIGDATKAQIMFSTFLDPDSFELSCGMYEKNVNACYNETFKIGCDSSSNTATIKLYVRDETYDFDDRTDNPKIGNCFVGTLNTISRAKKFTRTFQCEGTPDVSSGPGTCTDTSDQCLDGTYCAYSSTNGYECRAYAAVGSACGGRTISGPGDVCDPDVGYCFFADSCIIADKPGVCTAFFGDCVTDKDCGDPATRYCDEAAGKCKARLTVDQCCIVEENQCASGLSCLVYAAGFTCQNTRLV